VGNSVHVICGSSGIVTKAQWKERNLEKIIPNEEISVESENQDLIK
ncbi:27531_t:CDS:1, partial [Dentiscutata erythropus]